jgi:ABC-type multidrug transport system fused ATPase/permease subunit
VQASTPFILIACMGILYIQLGWTFVFGICVFALAFRVNVQISRKRAQLQKEYMKKQDKRLDLTEESLTHIKMLKLNSLTDTFLQLIDARRDSELAVFKKNVYYGIMMVTTLYMFPLILQSVTFVSFIGFDGTMTLSKTFSVLTTLSIIQRPIRMFPLFVGQVIEFVIAMKRV